MRYLPSPLPYLRYSWLVPSFLIELRKALLPIEDQWTWLTQDGAIFEDVAVEGIDGDQVIFQHKFGRARVPITFLSEDSRRKLNRGYGLTDDSASYVTEAETFEKTKFATPEGKQEKAAEHVVLWSI